MPAAWAVLAALGVPMEALSVTADAPGFYHPGQSGTVRQGPKTVLATFGALHPRVLAALDLTGPAVAFEVYLDAIQDPKKTVIVQVAPAVRAAIGESFGSVNDTFTMGRIVSALRRLGFDKVYDTSFSADLTIWEEATEFVNRKQQCGDYEASS